LSQAGYVVHSPQ